MYLLTRYAFVRFKNLADAADIQFFALVSVSARVLNVTCFSQETSFFACEILHDNPPQAFLCRDLVTNCGNTYETQLSFPDLVPSAWKQGLKAVPLARPSGQEARTKLINDLHPAGAFREEKIWVERQFL